MTDHAPISPPLPPPPDEPGTVTAEFEEFMALCFPGLPLDGAQGTDCRRVFFAGALSMFNLIFRYEPGDEPTESDMARMQAWYDEVTNTMAMLLDPRFKQ